MTLDPATHAVRRDLADVELADRVFAPHYARALLTVAIADDTPIFVAGDMTAEIRGRLGRGEAFGVLEITDDFAWGQATVGRTVGFVDRHALSAVAE